MAVVVVQPSSGAAPSVVNPPIVAEAAAEGVSAGVSPRISAESRLTKGLSGDRQSRLGIFEQHFDGFAIVPHRGVDIALFFIEFAL